MATMATESAPTFPRGGIPPGPMTTSVRTELDHDATEYFDRLLFLFFWITFWIYTTIIVFDTWLLPNDWCPMAVIENNGKSYPNPDSKANDPCYYHHSPWLLGLNPFECDFGRRVLSSVLFGAVIGFERKAADRPAGIRTMSLVCLGACMFTMCGQFAFQDSPQTWDAARVSAAVPSGVGFLGSALIWKESVGVKGTADEKHQVHGLTTACSLWLSASVGIGAGGGLYLYCTWAVVLVVFILRLGPRLMAGDTDDSSYQGEGTDGDWDTGSEHDDVAREADERGEEAHPPTREEELNQIRREAASVSIRPPSKSIRRRNAAGTLFSLRS